MELGMYNVVDTLASMNPLMWRQFHKFYQKYPYDEVAHKRDYDTTIVDLWTEEFRICYAAALVILRTVKFSIDNGYCVPQ